MSLLENETDQMPDENLVMDTALRPRTVLERVRLGLMIIFWILFLSLPCILFFLAAVGEVRISHIQILESDIHPFFQLNVITEPRQRGFKLMRSVLVELPDNSGWCVQTHVDYVLWTNDGSAESAVYHDVYLPSDEGIPFGTQNVRFEGSLQGYCNR